jgi:hypothetical protein
MKNIIAEQFVSYEIAKKLKEKGFNEPCFGLFNQIKELCSPQINYAEWKSFVGQSGVIPAPLHQQVVGWFFDKYCFWIEVYFDNSLKEFYTVLNGEEYKFKTQQEAYNAAFDYILKELI